MTLTDSDVNRVEGIVKLTVREYFDNYLENVLPKQFLQHESSCSHGKKFIKLLYFSAGALFAGGAGTGFTIAKLFGG